MTEARKNMISKAISDYIAGDKAKASELFGMSADDAVTALNAAGADITLDELAEYSADMKDEADRMKNNDGELSEEALDNVAGGISLLVAGVAAFGLWAASKIVSKENKSNNNSNRSKSNPSCVTCHDSYH